MRVIVTCPECGSSWSTNELVWLLANFGKDKYTCGGCQCVLNSLNLFVCMEDNCDKCKKRFTCFTQGLIEKGLTTV